MTELFLITLLSFLATGIGTMAGFGSSTIMIPVLVVFYPFTQALLLAGIIHWFGDLWDVLLFRKAINWKLVMSFGIPSALAAFFGAYALFSLPIPLLSRLLGGFLMLYALFLATNATLSLSDSRTTSAAGGTVSGFLTGALGVGGALRGLFLSALNMPKETYIATAAAVALSADAVRLVTYTRHGLSLEPFLLGGLIIFAAASFAGAESAKEIVKRIPQKTFQICIGIFLFLAGAKLLFFTA